MKRSATLLLACLLLYVSSQAQYGHRRYFRPRQPSPRFERLPKFTPSLSLSFGYGYPNLDKNELLSFYNYYHGSVSQTGPVTASLDYQFRRTSSIGLMVSYGKVSTPYYNFNGVSTDPPSFTGSLKNWSIMLNMIRYMPVPGNVKPYIRTAIGVNIWDQDYLEPSGNKAFIADDPTMLAYQVGLGAKFNVSKHGGLFIEAGYGKYIVSGGLNLKF